MLHQRARRVLQKAKGAHHRRAGYDPSRREMIGGGAVLAAAALLTGSAPPSIAATRTAADVRPLSGPVVHGRDAWKARKPARSAKLLNRGPRYIVVHHTASPNVKDRSQEQAFKLSKSIQRYHMDHNGWGDTGQQLTISRGGYIMEGRSGSLSAIRAGRHLVGAHAGGHNADAVGIENEGHYVSNDPPEALWDALIEACAWLCTAYDLDGSAIVGHRDLVATACPGEQFYDMLPQLRDDVDALLAASKA